MLACTEFPKFWCPTPKLLRESGATCCCGFVSEVSASHHCIGLSGLLTLSFEICRKSWLPYRSSAQHMPKLSLWPLLLQIFFCSCTIWFLLFYIWGVGPTRQQRRCWRICSQSGLWPSCKSKFSVVKSQSSEHVLFFLFAVFWCVGFEFETRSQPSSVGVNYGPFTYPVSGMLKLFQRLQDWIFHDIFRKAKDRDRYYYGVNDNFRHFCMDVFFWVDAACFSGAMFVALRMAT